MASASSSSARHLFSDSKRRLAERVSVNVNNIGSVARQVVRSSRSPEILLHAAKSFASLETAMDNSAQNLQKIELVRVHMGYQAEAIRENTEKLDDIRDQVLAMER